MSRRSSAPDFEAMLARLKIAQATTGGLTNPTVGSAAPAFEAFQSVAEMNKAIEDKRYGNDPAYMAEFDRKAAGLMRLARRR